MSKIVPIDFSSQNNQPITHNVELETQKMLPNNSTSQEQLVEAQINFNKQASNAQNIVDFGHRDNRANYNADKIPPEFQIAIEHGIAYSVGREAAIQENIQPKFCQCCARRVEREKYSICDNPKVLSNYGSGYPLFFLYIKYCAIILLLVIISSGIVNIVTSEQYGKDCIDPEAMTEDERNENCQKNYVTIYSLGNKKTNSEMIDLQTILNFISILIVIILLQYFRRDQRIKDIECDEACISANDYTILVSNIPKDFKCADDDYDSDIQNFMQTQLFPGKTINIKEISMCYDLDEYYKIIDQKNEILDKKKDAMDYYFEEGKYEDDVDITEIDKKLEDMGKQIEQYQLKFAEAKNRTFMKDNFTGYAFITFETEQIKDEVLNTYKTISSAEAFIFKKKSKDLIYQGNKLKVMEAPIPSDVFWENLQYSEKQTTNRIYLSYIITILLLGGCFIIIYLTIMAQRKLKEAAGGGENSQLISIGLAIIIPALNALIQFSLIKLTEFEKHPTRTEYNINLCRKVAFAQFVNSSLINFLVQVIFYPSDRTYYAEVFGVGGLAYDQFMIFVTSSIIPFVTEAIDIPYIQKKALRKVLENTKDKIAMTQKQLNDIYEEPVYAITQRYCLILNIMYNSAFYCAIIPMSLFLSLLSLFLTYWVDKYNLFNKRTIAYGQSYALSIEMTEMLEFFLPIYSLAIFLFFLILGMDEDEVKIPKLVVACIIVGFIHAALPMQEFNKLIFKIPDAIPNELTYDQAIFTFRTDYARENPASSKLALDNHIRRIQLLREQKKQQDNYEEITAPEKIIKSATKIDHLSVKDDFISEIEKLNK